MNVGFIDLGNMEAEIAVKLIKAGPEMPVTIVCEAPMTYSHPSKP